MKKNYVVLLFLFAGIKINAQQQQQNELVTVPFEQQMATVFQNVDLSYITSHHLLDRAFKLSDPDLYDGTLNTNNLIDYNTWCAVYGTLYTAAWQSQYRLTMADQSYKPIVAGLTQTNVVPILLFHYNYHEIIPTAVSGNLLSVTNNQIYDVPGRVQSPYQLHSCFAAAPLINKFTIGTIQFKIQNNLYFTNTGKTISSVQINFNDGNGFVTVAMNTPVTVTYTTAGDYEVITKINYTDGSSVQSHSSINVDISLQQQFTYSPSFGPYHITASKPYQGQYGGATVSIFYACGNTAVTKPLFIVEGFDPPPYNSFDYRFIYQRFNNNIGSPNGNSINLYNELDLAGFDLIYIDFDNGADYIQKNAYVVEAVINDINAKKHANNSTEQNIIAGFSMGGLVARFALRDMEANNAANQQHECRKYISFDTPHNGANIPLGLQFLINHLSGASIFGQNVSGNNPSLTNAIDILNTPAAQQMLYYHYSLAPAYNLRTQFYNDLNNLGNDGWPVNCQNIAISNGSLMGSAQLQPFGAGSLLISAHHSFSSSELIEIAVNGGGSSNFLNGLISFSYWFGPGADVDIDVHALPPTSNSWFEVYHGKFESSVLWGLITVSLSEWTVEVKNHLSLDNAPGGIVPISAYINSSANLPSWFNINLTQFCFIPTISSLALTPPQNQDAYYSVYSNGSAVNKFSQYAGPGFPYYNTNQLANESHISLGYNNVLFLEDNVVDLVQPLLNSVQNVNGQDFNFGANTVQHTDNRITNDVTISNGGKVCVNCDAPLGFTGSGLSNPTQLSSFNVYTTSCSGNTEVIIDNNGILECGNTSPANKGNLFFKSGSTLQIKNGGKLVIHDNSSLIIESGATIIIEPGAIIELQGANALLDVQGILNNITLNAAEQISFNKATATTGGTAKFASGTLTMNPGSTLASDGCRVLFNGTTLNYTHDATFYLNEPEAYIYFDPTSDITLNSSETLLLTKGSSSPGGILQLNTGTFNLNAGNITSDNCKLKLNDYNFNYFQNSNINLNGDEAEVRFGGYIYLMPNSDFHFNGSGYFGFKLIQNWGTWKNVIADPTATITITGSNPSDRIVEVESDSWFNINDQLNKLKIHNGTVFFGDNATLNVAAPFEFSDLEVTTLTPYPWGGTGSTGFVVGGQSNHKIENINFHRLNYGIRGYLFWATGSALNIRNCHFYDCNYPGVFYDKGVHFYDCTFFNCDHAAIGNAMTFPSSFYHVDVNSSMTAMDFSTLGFGSLFINRSTFNVDQGIIYSGSNTITVKCSEVHAGMLNNFYINQNASLNMSTSIAGIHGGYNDIYSVSGINFDNANQAFLENGYNNFATDDDLTMVGTLDNNCLAQLPASDNKWNTSNFNSPVNGINYLLHRTNNCNPPGHIMSVIDNTPNFSSCNMPHPIDITDASIFANRNYLPVISSPHFHGVPLNVAVKMALDTMSWDTIEHDDIMAIQMFSEILTASLRYDNEYINALSGIAYTKMKEALGNAIQNGRITQLSQADVSIGSVIEIIQKQIENYRQRDNDNNEFYAHIDLAGLYRMINDRNQALAILRSLPRCLRLEEAQISFLYNLINQINAEEMVLNGSIKIEEFEDYAGLESGNRTFLHYLNTQANIDSVLTYTAFPSNILAVNSVQDVSGNSYTISCGMDSSLNYKITKTNNVSDVIWEQQYDGKLNAVDSVIGIAIDNNNFIYVTGKSWNGLDFDIATIKYDSAGNQYWTAIYNDLNIGNDVPVGIEVDSLFNIRIDAITFNDTTQLFKSIYYSQCDSNCIASFRGQNQTLKNKNKSLGLNIYPNPTSGKVNFEINGSSAFDSFQIEIYDIIGKKIFSQFMSHKFTMDATFLSKGIYQVIVSGQTEKHLKQKLIIH